MFATMNMRCALFCLGMQRCTTQPCQRSTLLVLNQSYSVVVHRYYDPSYAAGDKGGLVMWSWYWGFVV